MLAGETNLPLRIANAVIAYARYLAMTVWPVNLAVFYPYEFHPQPAMLVVSAALIVGVTIAAVTLIRRVPYLAVGWFWFLGTLVPTIGLVQVGAVAGRSLHVYSFHRPVHRRSMGGGGFRPPPRCRRNHLHCYPFSC